MSRSEFAGKVVGVAGLGVSGVAAARALAECGASVTVFDQRPSDHPGVVAATDELLKSDVEVIAGWHGHLQGTELDALVVSPGFRRDHPAIRDMTRGEVLSEVELAYRLAKAPILAITGTNGKSTTTVLLWTLFSAGAGARLCGNVSGSGYTEEALTSAAMAAKPDEFLVAEVSSFQLEFVSRFRPRVATLTNVTPDHFDRHPDFADYRATKLRLFAQMGEGDTVVVNLDEPSVDFDREALAARGVRVVTFSPSGSEGGNGVTRREGDTLLLGDKTLNFDDLKIFGAHNIANVMTAWEMAAAVQPLSTAALSALKEFPGLHNRLEYLGERDGVRVFNNSMCTNPDAAVKSSQALPNARQHLLMGGLTKGLDFAPFRDYVQQTTHQIYLFGEKQESLNEMLGGHCSVYNNLRSAFEAAVAAAKPGEAVLLSPGCASSEPYANFRERGNAFRQITKDWLNHGTKDRS